ncbi:MAG: hypothetical protein R3199_11235 [Gemmatimonadota bacterium]|nr:hypothetical protein [Gemmatimonadota bacterium]
MSESPARTVLLLSLGVLTAALYACAEPDGPVGTPGGHGDLELRFVTPRMQVVPVGSPRRLELAVRLQRRLAEEETKPVPGATLRIMQEKGTAAPLASRATTDADGVASIAVEPSPSADRSEIVFVLEEDRRVFLSFGVVTAPIIPVDLEPGEVDPEVDVPRAGALLRFRFQPGDEAILVPFQTDEDRGGMAYRFLYQGSNPREGSASFGLTPPDVSSSRPGSFGTGRGHVVTGEIEGGIRASTRVAPSVNIRSCKVSVDRAAPLRYLGRRVALYVDAPRDRHQARIDSIGREFDESIYPATTKIFGPTPDLDGNGVVIVVMTPELKDAGGAYCNGLQAAGVEALHTGWRTEEPIARTFGTLAHEHQHLVNAAHHLRTRGESGDERWLNEALSYAAEALQGYWNGPLTRIAKFLRWQNGGRPMLDLSFSSAFNGNYTLFALYLGDRFGSGVYRRLGESGRVGVDNVEEATGTEFGTILRDWFLANALSDRGWTDDPRFRYRTVDLHGMAEEIAGCRCVPGGTLSGMNLESIRLDSPFDVFRSMFGLDADYYRLLPPEGEGGTFDVFVDPLLRPTTRFAVARSPRR